jgi:hypothetical protein
MSSSRSKAIEWLASSCLAAAAVCLCLWILYFNTLDTPTSLRWDGWAFFDWLINYQGGFVRRGLVGHFVSQYFYGAEISAVNHMVFYLGGLFFVLSAVYAVLFITKPKGVLLYLFAPMGIIWMAAGDEYYYRKEVCFYVCMFVAGFLYTAWKRSERRWIGWILIAFIFLATLVMPFVHETYVFFSLLVFMAMLQSVLRVQAVKLAGTLTTAFVLLNISQFVLACVFKGDAATGRLIWDSLSPQTRAAAGGNAGAIAALGWSFTKAISLPIAALLGGVATYYLFSLLVTYLITGYIVSVVRDRPLRDVYTEESTVSTFLAAVGITLPLFAMGWDWGRWVTGAGFAFFLMMTLELEPPGWLRMRARAAGVVLCSAPVLTLFILSLFTRVPECCFKAPGGLGNYGIAMLLRDLRQLLY